MSASSSTAQQIYNYRETMAELTRLGHRFATASDTEVIVHGWEEWGPACLDHFRGMFAFALWDRQRQTLFMARDRLGKKPLHYALLPDGQLVFASEMRAMLCHPGIERRIDPVSVDQYFALGYVPEPGSIYEGIRKLPAAHYLLIERGKPLPRPQRYWTLRFNPTPMTEADASEELIDRLREATRLRLVSDVPLGAFLSGGVDSSGVVAMMAGLQPDPVRTFAIGFGGAEDELGYAQAVADRYHTDHTTEHSSVNYVDAIDEQAAIFGEPFADSSAVPTGPRVRTGAARGNGRLVGRCRRRAVRRLSPLPLPFGRRADAERACPTRIRQLAVRHAGRALSQARPRAQMAARQDQLPGAVGRRGRGLLSHRLQDTG